jgi:hypothetical protein
MSDGRPTTWLHEPPAIAIATTSQQRPHLDPTDQLKFCPSFADFISYNHITQLLIAFSRAAQHASNSTEFSTSL